MPDMPTPPVIENIQNKNIVILVGIVLLIIVMGGLISTTFFFKKTPSTSNPNSSPVAPLPTEVKVSLTKDGFEPQSVKIKAGGAVRWTNTSGDEATVNSDDYPTNQKFKELNLGTFSVGSTLVHIFTKPGTYTYHDHFHPERKGTVVVE